MRESIKENKFIMCNRKESICNKLSFVFLLNRSWKKLSVKHSRDWSVQ